MLRQVAAGVLIHESEFCQRNAVVVQGRDGALLIAPEVERGVLVAARRRDRDGLLEAARCFDRRC